jgi:hypothetical protein
LLEWPRLFPNRKAAGAEDGGGTARGLDLDLLCFSEGEEGGCSNLHRHLSSSPTTL